MKLKVIGYRIGGVLFLAEAAAIWAWMLGAFASLQNPTFGANVNAWISPGFLGFGALVSLGFAIAGLWLLLTRIEQP